MGAAAAHQNGQVLATRGGGQCHGAGRQGIGMGLRKTTALIDAACRGVNHG